MDRGNANLDQLLVNIGLENRDLKTEDKNALIKMYGKKVAQLETI